MTDPLQLFPARVALGRTKSGELIFATPEFLRALAKVFQRVGGATGPSTTDLNISDDEDSGLEEFRAEQFKQNDAFAMLPPVVVLPQEATSVESLQAEIAGLREEYAQLRTMFEDLMRGMSL